MRLVALYTLSGFTGFCATMSALPAWLAEGGAASSAAGLVTTTLLVATIGAQSLVPRLVSTLGTRATLALGAVALGAPSLLLLVDAGYLWVVAICLVRGVGFGIVTVLGALLTAQIAPPSRHGEAMGIYGLAIAIPNLLAVAGGVALVSAGLFPVVAILGAAPLLGLATLRGLGAVGDGDAVRSRPDDEVPSDLPMSLVASSGTAAAHARQARRAARRAALSPAVVLMVVTLTSGGFMTYIPIAHPDGALATLALLVWGAFGAGARWQTGLLADRIGMRLLLPVSSLFSVVGIGAVAGALLLDGPAGAVTTLVGAAVLGIGFGASQNLTLVAAFRRARQREQATVSAVWNTAFDAGTAIGSGLVGLLAAAVALPGALALTAALVLASLPLAIGSARSGKAGRSG